MQTRLKVNPFFSVPSFSLLLVNEASSSVVFGSSPQTSAFVILVFFSIMNYCFWFGLAGLATSNNRNLVLVLLSIELLLLGISGFFLLFSFYHFLTVGQIYVLVLMTLAGAESALGLALMVLIYRLVNTLNLNAPVLTNLKY